ncbi:MAG: hypothetical protein WCB49_08530 [Gammaproteobacteria bacterium]
MTGGFFHEAFSSNGRIDRGCRHFGSLLPKTPASAAASTQSRGSRKQYPENNADQADDGHAGSRATNQDEGAKTDDWRGLNPPLLTLTKKPGMAGLLSTSTLIQRGFS